MTRIRPENENRRVGRRRQVLKLTIALLAVAAAGSASAAGWRSLRLDATTEVSFRESVAEFQEKLPPPHWYAFGMALQEIWTQGAAAAAAENHQYTASDYFRQLDGLGYAEVVRITDPTGATEQQRRVAYEKARRDAQPVPDPTPHDWVGALLRYPTG